MQERYMQCSKFVYKKVPKMINEIKNLLNNSKVLAEIWANVYLKDINFNKIVIPDEDQPRGDGIESLTIISCRNDGTYSAGCPVVAIPSLTLGCRA
jgi:hypothetical protein